MAADGETASGPAHTPGTNTPGASTPADVELPSPRVRETTTEADYSYDTKPGMFLFLNRVLIFICIFVNYYLI